MSCVPFSSGVDFWSVAGQAGEMAQPKDDYETADYKVLISDVKFEVRDYPDLMLAATTSNQGGAGADGSFMKLFRYISGGNEANQKIPMTTPVFMSKPTANSSGQMGFVMPKEVAEQGVPIPTVGQVAVRKRPGGRFAVIRFSGVMTSKLVEQFAAELRAWMEAKGLKADEAAEGGSFETAGYDSPFTPGSERRNEILIRLKSDG
jgi:hypothetical protein